jgi:hypothetical protein
VNNELERMWKEAVIAVCVRKCHDVCLDGLRKTWLKYPCRDLKPGPPCVKDDDADSVESFGERSGRFC